MLGRFIQADPEPPDSPCSQSGNRYSYCGNNPLNATDPSGFEDSPTGAAGQTDSSDLEDESATTFPPYLIQDSNTGQMVISTAYSGNGSSTSFSFSTSDNLSGSWSQQSGTGGGLSFSITPKSVAGWLFDQANDLALTLASTFSRTASGASKFGADWFYENGFPNAGNSSADAADFFGNAADDIAKVRGQAARAGWYDPNHPVTKAANVAVIFLNPESAPELITAEAAPKAYSVAFQMQLKTTELGLSRAEQAQIANDALKAERSANPALAKLVPEPVRLGRPPPDWSWHHATIDQGHGQAGIMQLVPRDQHTAGSAYSDILHPLPGRAGGYSQWAIPAGAPPN